MSKGLKYRILYEYVLPSCTVTIFRNGLGRVVVVVNDGDYVLTDLADEGYDLTDETAYTLAIIYSAIFEKEQP